MLKLVFAEPLAYVHGEGYRTAEISMPFKLLGGIDEGEKVMVPGAASRKSHKALKLQADCQCGKFEGQRKSQRFGFFVESINRR